MGAQGAYTPKTPISGRLGEKTHLINVVKNLFYQIYDYKLDDKRRALFDSRYEALTGRPGFKNNNWLADFREALMHFETLFADLLGKHQTKLYRGLGHLKTLILLMSLEAPSITPGKVDLAKWAGFSYFCFVQVPP
jgi:hypothetical protein